MPLARYSSLAREDIDTAAAAIAADNPNAARRFQQAVKDTIQWLTAFPRMAAVYPHPDYPNLRAKLVTGFSNYVIFYTESDDGVYLVRILHAARDIPRLL